MGDGHPSERILRKVADETDTDILELPPLYQTVDVDHLDKIIESMDDGSISFTYYGENITVTSEGTVRLSDEPFQAPAKGEAVAND